MESTEERLATVMAELERRSDQSSRAGMARYGIDTSSAYGGSSMPVLRAMAKRLGRDQELAVALWATGNHEARLIAPMIADPAQVTEALAERWVADFDSWDICDQCCSNLLDRTPFAYDKAREWVHREEEFVRRTGFVLMATLAVHDKGASDQVFLDFLPLIEGGAADERNFVKKAVNWALRQIGKRNLRLNEAAIECAERITKLDSGAARWVAKDALRELRSEAVQTRLARAAEKRAQRTARGGPK